MRENSPLFRSECGIVRGPAGSTRELLEKARDAPDRAASAGIQGHREAAEGSADTAHRRAMGGGEGLVGRSVDG
jgi:hypothetical protein